MPPATIKVKIKVLGKKEVKVLADSIVIVSRPGTTPAEPSRSQNSTTTEDTLPTTPRVFQHLRHARTNCPICQKDISSSYIDTHLRNMYRKE